jgi:hypothetical protein
MMQWMRIKTVSWASGLTCLNRGMNWFERNPISCTSESLKIVRHACDSFFTTTSQHLDFRLQPALLDIISQLEMSHVLLVNN